jgi:hypothetical protein
MDLTNKVFMEYLGNEVWYHGYQVSWTRRKGIGGGATMSQPTRPKDMNQEAHD